MRTEDVNFNFLPYTAFEYLLDLEALLDYHDDSLACFAGEVG